MIFWYLNCVFSSGFEVLRGDKFFFWMVEYCCEDCVKGYISDIVVSVKWVVFGNIVFDLLYLDYGYDRFMYFGY